MTLRRPLFLVALCVAGCGNPATSESLNSSSGSTASGAGASGAAASTGASSGSANGSAASSTGASTGASGSAGSTGSTLATGSTGSTSSASVGTSGTSSSSGAASTSSTGSSGSSGASGDCASDTDCPGSHCVEVTPGGFRECVLPPDAPEACTNGGPDACCPGIASSCPAGEQCVLGPLVPFCGGAFMMPYNQCNADQCQSDADCASSGGGAICVPAGTMGVEVRACLPAYCRTDADCGAPGTGRCEPVPDPCCGNSFSLACVGASGCRDSSECQSGSYCAIQNGSASCVTGGPICPG